MKLKINATRAYDGQGPLKNGIHDGAAGMNERLYRIGALDHLLWLLGQRIGRLLGKKYVAVDMCGRDL